MINGPEMLRLIDAISRDRNVEKDVLFRDIEQAMVSAARRHFGAADTEEFSCELDRLTGQIRLFHEDEEIALESLGRIPAQTAKQVMIQRFREDERESIYNEFIDRVGELVTGMAQRYEGGSLVVSIGRAEGFMPRSEQIPGEQHQPGERVRCLILDVREAGNQVKIVLSRAAPEFIRRLFGVEVPEVAERIIEIKAMAREAGHRTKIAVSSIDSKVDAVGACVGVRGSRIKNIVDELGGEKIDIVRWNESSQILIQNALKPAEVVEISLCFELGRATVVVNEDQLSLAIGKRGQNVRLAARLTAWDVDILTPAEYTRGLDTMEQTLVQVEGLDETQVDRLAALGLISVFDVEEVGPEYLMETLEIDDEKAREIITVAGDRAKEVAEEQQREKEEAERRKREEEAARAAMPGEQQAAAILGEEMPSQPAGGYSNEGEGGGGSIVEMLEQQQRSTPSEEPGEGETGTEPISEEPTEGVPEEGEMREEALAHDPGQTDAERARQQDELQPAAPEDPWEPEGGEPSGSDANEVEMTEAAQEGSPAQAMADATGSEAGTVAGTPKEAHQPQGHEGAGSLSSEAPEPADESVEGEEPGNVPQPQAEIEPEPGDEAESGDYPREQAEDASAADKEVREQDESQGQRRGQSTQ
ncbi:MAG: transcription termination factor NusA [Phycisphaeraceae bacterium]